MEVTLRAAYIALQIGPFIALIFALPYTVYGYIRTKIVDVWRCTYLYTFCLYFLCAYIHFYNHERIQIKTGVAPLTLRHSA